MQLPLIGIVGSLCIAVLSSDSTDSITSSLFSLTVTPSAVFVDGDSLSHWRVLLVAFRVLIPLSLLQNMHIQSLDIRFDPVHDL